MAHFIYRALTNAGERSDGEIEAPDQRTAIQMLQAKGLLPIEARPKKSGIWDADLLSSNKQASKTSPALMIATRELATLLQAGEPLERALQLICEETGDNSLSAALQRVATELRGGKSMAQAIEAEPSHFPKVYVGMVAAGEATGRITQTLMELADLAEQQAEARRKLVSSITYPLILTIVAISAVVFMLALVVPQFAPMLEGHEANLPSLTLIVLDLSSFLRAYGQTSLLVLLFVLGGSLLALRFQPIRLAMDRFFLDAGVLGRLPKERLTGQIARALGTLLNGGVDLPTSIAMTAEMVDNTAAQQALRRVRGEVRQGQRLADALAGEKLLNPMGLRLVRTGEESGRLGELAIYLANQMDRRVADRTSQLLTLLEPVLVVILGLVVGGITVSILSAMLSVNELAF